MSQDTNANEQLHRALVAQIREAVDRCRKNLALARADILLIGLLAETQTARDMAVSIDGRAILEELGALTALGTRWQYEEPERVQWIGRRCSVCPPSGPNMGTIVDIERGMGKRLVLICDHKHRTYAETEEPS